MNAYSKKLASKLGISSLTKDQLIDLVDWLAFKVALVQSNYPTDTTDDIVAREPEIVADAFKHCF